MHEAEGMSGEEVGFTLFTTACEVLQTRWASVTWVDVELGLGLSGRLEFGRYLGELKTIMGS
jgi:hypothetical protein